MMAAMACLPHMAGMDDALTISKSPPKAHGPFGRPKQTATQGRRLHHQPDHRMSSSSTSKTRAEYGGMEPAPRAP